MFRVRVLRRDSIYVASEWVGLFRWGRLGVLFYDFFLVVKNRVGGFI